MTCCRNNRRQRGFTMVEIMVALLIVAVLGTIAMSSFSKQSMRSRRSDALVALQQVAAAQERFYAINSRYSGNADPFAGTLQINSPQLLYTVAVTIPTGGQTFLATASPATGRSQATDSECTAFTLTNTGAQGSTGSLATAGTPLRCWN